MAARGAPSAWARLSAAAVCHLCSGIGSPEALGAAAAAQRLQGLATQLHAAAGENQALRRQLAEQQLVRVPPSLQAQLGPLAMAGAVAAAAAAIEAQLHQAETESSQLRQQLGLPEAPSPAADSPAQKRTAEPATAAEQQAAQLAARAEEAQAAGQEDEAEALRSQASQLEALVAQVRQADPGQAAEVRQQLRAAVAVGSAIAASEAAEQQAAARLDAATAAFAGRQGDEDGPGSEEEVAALQVQLAAARQQKEAAQAQLWELQELQQQLQACADKRQQLSAQLAAGQPASGEAEPAESAELRSQLADAQRQSAELLCKVDALAAAAAAAEPSMRLALQINGSSEAGTREAAERLAAAEAKAARLRQQLEDLQVGSCCAAGTCPKCCAQHTLARFAACARQYDGVLPASVCALCASDCEMHRALTLLPLPAIAFPAQQPLRLQLSVGGIEGGAGARRSLESALGSPAAIEASPSDLPLLTAEPSDLGAMTALLYSSEHASALSAERRAADAALLEYQKVGWVAAAGPATCLPATLMCRACWQRQLRVPGAPRGMPAYGQPTPSCLCNRAVCGRAPILVRCAVQFTSSL